MKFEEKLLNKLFDKLFPINRSIMGDGYRKSLKILGFYFDFKYKKFKTKKKVFDWVVPNEWNITEAYIKFKNKKIIDFKKNNLHVVSYSHPTKLKISLDHLQKHLFSLKRYPKLIPYVTSYYKKFWGFSLEHSKRKKLKKGIYQVVIKSSLKPGFLENGLAKIDGNSSKVCLLTSYLCHPSMANNELSGPLVLLGLYLRIKKWKNRNLNYHFLINPETIGSICYLSDNKNFLKKNMHSGMVLTCLGGPKSKLSYKKSRIDNSPLNKIFSYFEKKKIVNLREFDPRSGSDERQYCSSELNLPMGQISRTIYDQYYQYHTSGDNKKFMNIKQLVKSIDTIENILKLNDWIFPLKRYQPYCEPQLGKRNLYPNIGFDIDEIKKSSDVLVDNAERLNILVSLLSYADGEHDIIDISKKLNMDVNKFPRVLDLAIKNKLIKQIS